MKTLLRFNLLVTLLINIVMFSSGVFLLITGTIEMPSVFHLIVFLCLTLSNLFGFIFVCFQKKIDKLTS